MEDYCRTDTPRARISDLELLPDGEAAKLSSMTHALADPLRVQMVHLLSQQPDLCTCEIESLLGIGQSKVSYHLRVLLEAGVVTRQVHGTWSHYSLHDRGILDRARNLLQGTVTL